MAEEAVADMPLDNLEWFHEKFILDYFAEVGLFLRHGNTAWAEVTLNQLIWLRSESPDIGPDHDECIYLKKYLLQAYREDGKKTEASGLQKEIETLGTYSFPKAILLIIDFYRHHVNCVSYHYFSRKSKEEAIY